MNRVVVAGGGIAGLAIAHELKIAAPGVEVVLVESRDRLGGNIRSERDDGFLCEWGPDGFLDSAPATLALVDRLGLRPLRSRDAARRRFVFRRGWLHEVPLSPGAFLKSPLLSLGGKLRIACEPFAAHRPGHDESIHAFAARRIGREAADVMVGSMVSGIFAGDARELSLRACFPKMWEMEDEYGGLFRALVAKRRQRGRTDGIGSPAGTLTSFDGGMEDLIRALARSLGGAVRLNAPVVAIRERPAREYPEGLRPVGARAYSVLAGAESIEADAVVLSGPASDAAALLGPIDPALAPLVAAIPTAPLAVVCLGYDGASCPPPLGGLSGELRRDGFGFLVPRGEGPRILGALWESSIYEGRAPDGKVLLRAMIGGATDPGAIDLDDEALLQVVRDDLRTTMGIETPPGFVKIVRHRRGIPQYTAGHVSRLQRIEHLLLGHPGLFLAGNSYHGVSVNACVEAAPRIAGSVLAHLRSVRDADVRSHAEVR